MKSSISLVTGGVERLQVDSSGRLGVNTTPNTPIHVASGSNGSGLIDVARFQNTGINANDGARIQLTAGTSTSGAGIGCLGCSFKNILWRAVIFSGAQWYKLAISRLRFEFEYNC